MEKKRKSLYVQEKIGPQVVRHALIKTYGSKGVYHPYQGAGEEKQYRADADPEEQAFPTVWAWQGSEYLINLWWDRLVPQNLIHQQLGGPGGQHV